MKLIIISGRSGSGKSISLRCLEDLGYYVVDNLPWILLPDLLANLSQSHTHVAISLDSRNIPGDPRELDQIFQQVLATYKDVEALYLDADDHTLLKRYSETRRKHPLSSNTVSLQEAIAKERILLEPVANRANLFIDTCEMSPHQLSCLMRDRIAPREENSLSILFQSFGFKYGIPNDADYLFDIRCLPNPYWEPELRPLTGRDQPVIDFLQEHSSVKLMESSIEQFLETWIPAFKADRRSYLTIAIGCTGGLHRSVYMAERLSDYFSAMYKSILVRHRELK
jgi:RNase adapter protein RapZ